LSEKRLETGERDSLYPFLAPDAEWVAAARSRRVDEIRRELTWVGPSDKLDLAFERGELVELGEGRVASRCARSTR
jgi:hypothetical protein